MADGCAPICVAVDDSPLLTLGRLLLCVIWLRPLPRLVAVGLLVAAVDGASTLARERLSWLKRPAGAAALALVLGIVGPLLHALAVGVEPTADLLRAALGGAVPAAAGVWWACRVRGRC